jgi:thioesterase domain-containing protein
MAERRAYLASQLARFTAKVRLSLGLRAVDDPVLSDMPPVFRQVRLGTRKAFIRYRPQPYAGKVVLFRALERTRDWCDGLPLWQRLATNGLEVRPIPSNHLKLIAEPAASILAAALTECLERPASELSQTAARVGKT